GSRSPTRIGVLRGITHAFQRFSRILLRKLRRLRIGIARFQQDSGIPSPHDFGHAREIILSFDGANAIAPVAIFVWHAVTKTDHGGDNVGGADVGDVETFHY